jgi:hypothetical protein
MQKPPRVTEVTRHRRFRLDDKSYDKVRFYGILCRSITADSFLEELNGASATNPLI